MKELQEKVRNFVEKNSLEASPEIRALDLVSELGELSKEILKSTNYGKSKPVARKEIELELGDLLFSTICLANKYDVDLEKALNNAIEKYSKRLKSGGAGSEFQK